MQIVDVKGLTVKINDRLILEDINFSVERGDILGVLGSNGAGKTTLFRAILHLIRYEGEVSLFGYKDERALPFISYLPQRFSIDTNFPITVKDLLATSSIQLKYIRKHSNLIKDYSIEEGYDLEEALKMVGLEEKKHVRLANLSGGELQRALLARALITRSPLLILDEPFTALDVNTQLLLLDILTMLNKELKVTIILAAHDLLLLMKLAKNIMCLMNRKIFFHGSKDECMNNDIIKSYSGESAMHIHLQDHLGV
ncbi:MAG: ATP-binding cassette domain-containing protein [Candidatus Nitrosocaldaceae archaeon]